MRSHPYFPYRNQMGFLCDGSISMVERMRPHGSRIAALQDAVSSGILALEATDPGCVVWIGSFNHVFMCLIEPVTVDEGLPDLLGAVEGMVAGGMTHFLPALEGALDIFDRFPSPSISDGGVEKSPVVLQSPISPRLVLPDARQGEGQGRKILLFLSDGQNNGPDPLPAAEELRRSSIEIHCVGVANRPGQVDAKILKKIASRDGVGKPFYRFIKDGDLLVQHFVAVAQGIVKRI